MQTGDRVEVTNIDGETAEGKIAAILPGRCDEHKAAFFGPRGATLYDYWRGEDVDPDERVVEVELGDKTYDYPESRVEVVD